MQDDRSRYSPQGQAHSVFLKVPSGCTPKEKGNISQAVRRSQVTAFVIPCQRICTQYSAGESSHFCLENSSLTQTLPCKNEHEAGSLASLPHLSAHPTLLHPHLSTLISSCSPHTWHPRNVSNHFLSPRLPQLSLPLLFPLPAMSPSVFKCHSCDIFPSSSIPQNSIACCYVAARQRQVTFNAH